MTKLEAQLNSVRQQSERQTVQNLVFDTERHAFKTNENFLKERYHHLLSALDETHMSFAMGEKLRITCHNLGISLAHAGVKNEMYVCKIASLITEKDQFAEEVYIVNQAYEKEKKFKLAIVAQANEKNIRYENLVEVLRAKNEDLSDKLYKLDQASKQTIKERDRLRSKIIRMKNQQKIAFSVNKTCVNCKIDYRESENFNWSCRTHPSDWGGTVWWCCGKTDPNH